MFVDAAIGGVVRRLAASRPQQERPSGRGLRLVDALPHATLDLHAHVLPGLDDGPATLEESLELLRDAAADGITHVAATPHVREDFPTDPAEMEARVAELNRAASDAGIPVTVLPGGELDPAHLLGLDDATLRRFGLGGNPDVLLVEFPYQGWPLHLAEIVFRLQTRGFTVVLAHPERNAVVQDDPSRLDAFVDAGVLVQLTAASVDGRLGKAAQKAALALISRGCAHVVASDAHVPAVRATGLARAAASLRYPELARWLTCDVPGALLGGVPLPERPERRRSARRAAVLGA
ncbi:MAG TPA: CpsB/CapC family capsule biosynthesis tyrosine phosphatase [Gaiellaceae bacterium]|nr:CpsB/CapC family capsule biosynthesis tyrosine phosphatase [Gaiellaceae bacterium]